MKIEKELLEKLFTTVDKEQDKITVPCFASDYFGEFTNTGDENYKYPYYRAVTDAMHDSGLSHNFSYEIASRAVDILLSVEDWKDETAMQEAIDGSVPVYTWDIMQIYINDSWAVDEAVTEMGYANNTSEGRAKIGWYYVIENMVEAIITNFKK